MKKNWIRIIFLILTLFFLQSCDLLNKEGGSFNIKFLWEEGEEPSDDEKKDLYLWAILNEWKNGKQSESLEVAIAGPISFDSNEALKFDSLSFGSNRVVVIEIRDVNTREKNDNIKYYGRSDLFNLEEGKDTSVSVTMKLQKTFEDSENTDVVQILKKDTETPVEYTNESIVDIKIIAGKASKVVISNDSGFDNETEEVQVEDLSKTGEKGKYIYKGWELETDLGNGVKNIYVEMFNELGYSSGIKQDSVIFDDIPPATVSQSISPETLKKDGLANINVIFDEPVNDVSIISELTPVEDSKNQNGQTDFKWSYTENDDTEKTYPVSVQATDLAGNTSEIKIGDISIDATPPSLNSFTPVDVFITPGGSVEIQFELNEENDGPPEVKIGSYTLSAEECTNDELRYTCSHEETDGKLDKDGKTDSDADPAELDGEKKVSVSLTDLAGNTSEELLGTAIYDRIAPVVNGSVITPANAKAGSIISFSISFNETVSDLTLDSGDLDFEPCTSEDQYQFSCIYIVKGNETEGEYIVKTTATDTAGNTSDPTPATPFTIDLTGPEISVEDVSIVTDTGIMNGDSIPKAKDGSVVTVSFSVSSNETLSETPEVIIDNANALFQSLEEDVYTYSLNVEAAVSTDGRKSVILRTYDKSGNPGVTNIGNVIYDFTPPRIVDFSLKRVPELATALDNENNKIYFSIKDPISGETVRADIVIYADEKIVGPQLEVTGNGAKPVFNIMDLTEKKVTFSSELSDAVDSGEYGFKIIWEDELGNSSQDDAVEALLKMVVDKNIPDLSGTDLSKITYNRLPYGEKENPTARFFVTGEEGAVEPTDIAYFFNTPYEPSGTSYAGSVIPDSEGSFSVDTRSVGNSPYMYLRIGNRAGVLSEPKRVRLNKWIGTLNGKIPGSSAENGIEYGKRISRADSLRNSEELMNYINNFEDIEKLSAPDLDFLSTINDSNLKIKPAYPEELPDFENAEFIVDPVRGKIFIFNFPDETSQIDIYSVDLSSKIIRKIEYAGFSPNPRYGFNLIYNNYDNSIIFAGGGTHMNNRDDVWQFYPDLSEWVEISPDWTQIDPWVEDGTKVKSYPVPKAWASFIDVINYDIENHKFYYFRYAAGSYGGNHLNGVAVYDAVYKVWSSLEKDSTPIPFPDQYGFDVNNGFYDVEDSKLCFTGDKKIYRMDSLTGMWDTIDLSAVDYSQLLGFDGYRRKVILKSGTEIKSYNIESEAVKTEYDFETFTPAKLKYSSMDDRFYYFDDNGIVKSADAAGFTIMKAMKTPPATPAPDKTDGEPQYFYSSINDSLYVYMGYYFSGHYRQLWKYGFNENSWTNLEPQSQVYTSKPPSTGLKSIFFRKSTGRITVAGPNWESKGYFYEFDEDPEQMQWNEVLLGTDPSPVGTYAAATADYENEVYYFMVCTSDRQNCTVHSFDDINKTWNSLGIGIPERSEYFHMELIPDRNLLITVVSTSNDYDINKTLVYDISGSTLLATLTDDDSPGNIRTLSYIDFPETLLAIQADVYNSTIWYFDLDSFEWVKKEKTNALTADFDEGLFLFERREPESQILLLDKANQLFDFNYGYTSATENIIELPITGIYGDSNNTSTDLIKSVSVFVSSRAVSHDIDKNKTDGVQLFVWEKQRWSFLDSNNADPEETDPTATELRYTFSDSDDIRPLFNNGDLSLFLKIASHSFVRKDGQLDVDFFQIEIDYSFPECEASTCNDNGVCDDLSSPVLCECNDYFTGEFCEIEL